ncbi:conserved protein of unknown function [Denitratisoma oestradiolicum]|uniref:Uncharacterized protein n=2 Tax=Denitratisoma oestradiolicum TaxID=311182 RepID=A0A6S6XUK3_9PROT|nr:hypothetical protein CBW56_04235 [Denitratisoma oestradiolicum]CAB1368520.1 conserved protein of unknown function [Denitratisoma oestradiolicum]
MQMKTENSIEQAFWLTMANVFLPPMHPEVFVVSRNWLADDLQEMCDALGLDLLPDLKQLRRNLAGLASHEILLVDYSHLFLQPPAPASLNLSRYVDGGINGPCMDALENAYRRAGVTQSERMRDLPDHGAMQMETLAFLLGEDFQEAADFARLCLVGALPRLAQTVDEESPNSPYAPLSRIAAGAITRFTQEAHPSASQKKRRHDVSVGVWRHCKSCDQPFAREKEIQIMTRALAQAGLPATHLERCPDCRDAVSGFFKRSLT